MRHPRRPRRKRRAKHAVRWVVRADARATWLDVDHEAGVIYCGVAKKDRAPWTPARARSRKWVSSR